MGLPAELFLNPAWHALEGRHRHFLVEAGRARRYPAEVAPFGAVAEPTREAMLDLHSLLTPADPVWVIGESFLEIPELVTEQVIDCLQMVLPAHVAPRAESAEVEKLSDADAPEMVALTDLAFPGFFRPRTCDMGVYYGVRRRGELVAMGGERLMLGAHNKSSYNEISGVCTHPEHRGQGLAESIIWRLVCDHRRDGVVPWLHVTAANRTAIELYLRMGFEIVRNITVRRVIRSL
jgi:predicted GNAT family acetyltransferase